MLDAISAENMPGDRASPAPEGNFNFAARPVSEEYQVDGTAELMRNEIADEAAAITRLDRSRDRRAAKLAPVDRQGGRGPHAIPAYQHSAVRARERTVLRRIRHQLVNNHGDR